MNKEIYIVDAIRTGIGKFGGSLSGFTGAELGEIVVKSILARNKFDHNEISEVIIGQVLTGGYGQNPARQAALNAGLAEHISAYTINMVCGSGLKSVALAAESIMSGRNELVLAGGQESMSNAMHAMNLRNSARMGNATMIDTMINDGLTDAFNKYHMGITAENIAKKYNISRTEQDEFAVKSQNNAASAKDRFKQEITDVTIKSKAGDTIFNIDEGARDGTTIESLAKLKPVFDANGTVTAGNASGINDGAAMLLVASENAMKKHNLKPMVRIVASTNYGVDPAYMGLGPVFAVREVLKLANWNINDLDLIEANEAFAAQSIAVNKELNWDMSKVNVNGGAIALGHPIGASGARVLTSLIYEMKRRNAKKGLATLCIGGGMGIALCIENV